MSDRKSEAVPLLATERNPQRETLGPRDAKVAEHLGTPFIPWQRDAADLFGEIDPATGGPWYQQAVIILQRQVGKTTYVRARLTRRCITTPSAVVTYTAQNRLMAESRLENDFWTPLSKSALAVFLDQRVGRRSEKVGFSGSTGDEHIAFANGARWGVDAVKATSGHGPTLNDGAIDEAFAHKSGAIEAAMLPAMTNVLDAQLLVASAVGTHESTYLRAKVDAVSALVRHENSLPLSKRKSRTALIMYGAPLDADPEDPETYWSTHPGVGYLTTVERILGAREAFILNGEPEEADRAYLSWWPAKKAPDPVIPIAAWNKAALADDDDDWSHEPMWAIDVAPDRSMASIGLAGEMSEDVTWVEVPASEYGATWVVSHLTKLRLEFGGRQVAIDSAGGAGALEAALEKAGFDVIRLTTREVHEACQSLFDNILTRDVVHGADPVLTTAMLSAAKRTTDGGFVWMRGKSLADITPLYAATLAQFAFRTRRERTYNVLDSVLDPESSEDTEEV